MNKARRFGLFLLSLTVCLAMLLPVLNASAAESSPAVTTDADTAAKLGLLLGDGTGVSAAYLGKTSTRLQAAIISLRLQGKLSEAQAFTETGNFKDASLVSKSNQAILAYLNAHAELGWNGTGNGNFNPLVSITAQQFYKVLLEALGYKSGTAFQYSATFAFAKSKGLKNIAGAAELSNADIATALVEALNAPNAKGATLFAQLQQANVIAASAELPTGEHIGLAAADKLGSYLTDGKGRTLYYFTKDAADLESCQGSCLQAWPIFHADQLQIPSSLNAADFGMYMRADGTMQTTYKGWPLYYFAKDTAPGDVNGEAVGGVWFAAKSDYAAMLGTSATLGNYLTDANGRTLYYFDKDTAGSSVCEGTCLANWPAYLATGTHAPTGVASSDFGVITRTDGSKQSSYKGYPLYYFVKDSAHGDVNGQGLNNVWYVIDPVAFEGTTASAEVKTYRVDIKEYSFGTGPLTVEVGSKIIFTNYDDMKHNAVAVDGSFSTPLLAKGDSFTITMSKAGTYDYFCEPHKKFMTGQIIVK
ncbi:plastocyanin/azurin family copper-binding protein [Paenibacillus lignilyticus]|uniref:Cupredoxin domain-containing protein n=1 Tax=Paenibacillus lignilyticus TaxID=1172615 RepID=A0ABS5CGC6_9BACL|nr:plastocyanin/azurin family copper-binding protein [Paenibacillus lignilyticus]MBP3964939.1 cupredoxin domain-containing protein [Paenibacillus lignilyticus]